MNKKVETLKKLYKNVRRSGNFLFAGFLLIVLTLGMAAIGDGMSDKISEKIFLVSIIVSIIGMFFSAVAIFIISEISLNVEALLRHMKALWGEAEEIKIWEEIYHKLNKIDIGTLLNCAMKEPEEKKRLGRGPHINFYIAEIMKNKDGALSAMADEIQRKKDVFMNDARWCRNAFATKVRRYGRAFGLKKLSFNDVFA
jgi:hypothetical protein